MERWSDSGIRDSNLRVSGKEPQHCNTLLQHFWGVNAWGSRLRVPGLDWKDFDPVLYPGRSLGLGCGVEG